MHLDLHLGTLDLNANCTRGFSCRKLIAMINEAAERQQGAGDKVLCLGPLNDWFYTAQFDVSILRRCARYPLAASLERNGLPLRTKAAEMVASLRPSQCDACVYMRLPDGDHRPSSLAAAFAACNRSTSNRLAGAFRTSGVVGALDGAGTARESGELPAPQKEAAVVHGRQHVEVVSSCRPVNECRIAISQLDLRGAIGNLDVEWHLGGLPSGLAADLNLSAENAAVHFDVVRCARCNKATSLTRRSDTSSFWGQIKRLHHRMHDS